jgi:hypothetical protein
MVRDIDGLRKKPSTSELIDWIHALIVGGIPIESVAKAIPYLGTLLKKEADQSIATGYFNRNIPEFRRAYSSSK